MQNKLIRTLKKHEGLRLEPYLDSEGIATIGYGHNLEADGLSQKAAMLLLEGGITKDTADRLLLMDMLKAIQEGVDKYPWFNDLSENKQVVVYSMIFNMGISRFGGFKKFLAAAKAGEDKRAYHEMLDSRWARQVKSRAKYLANMYVMRIV